MLHLISSTSFLGAERVVCELANHLDPARFECVVGLIGSPEIVVEAVRHSLDCTHISVVHFPCTGKFSLATITSISDFMKNQHIDIVHSHGYKSNFYSQMARLSANKVRAVATNHNWITNSLSEKLYRFIDLLVLKRYSRIVAVSEDLVKSMSAAGICPDQIRLIMNGISLANPPNATKSSEIRSKFGILNGCYVIGCVASLIPVKAHADLLNAFSRLVKTIPDSMLLLIGDGPLHGDLKLMVQNLDFHDKVKFLGYRTDARELYPAFDLFALVSYSEGLPMAMLEAMAAALPIVASAVGSIPQVICPMKNGILIKPGDIDGIANSFIKLAQDPELRKSLGQNARSEVVTKYSVSRMARDYEQLYEKVLETSL